MIGVKLWGGLGNQMFQYAFGLYLAEKRNEKPYFFTDFNSKERLDIDYFKVSIDLLLQETLKKNGYSFQNHFLYRAKRKLIQKFPFWNQKIMVENISGFRPIISDKYSLFDGYWQSYKYLQPIEQKLRTQFVSKKNLILNPELYSEIKKGNSVSLHIRRGDYLKGKNTEIYENIPLAYYQAAIDYFSKEIDNPQFYVFSNDLNWVKNNLKTTTEHTFFYVDNTDTENATLADLQLMASCKHHIIANSTFSWWGAWLNPSKEKKVIAPKNWYKGEINDLTLDLIPSEWKRL